MREIDKLGMKIATLYGSIGMFENIPSHEEYEFHETKKYDKTQNPQYRTEMTRKQRIASQKGIKTKHKKAHRNKPGGGK